MKLFRVHIHVDSHYGTDNRKELEAADDAAINNVMMRLPSARSEHPDNRPLKWLVSDSDLGEMITYFGVRTYGKEPGVEKVELVYSATNPYEAINNMVDRLELSVARLTCEPQYHTGSEAHVQGWNHYTESPIVGPNLHQMNRLMLLEDCCTDRLQEQLDDGWRLIAVCPQEQRRPDYILGKCTAMERFGRADRG